MTNSTGPQTEAAPAARGPLSFPAYRMIWFGLGLSSFGTVIQGVGAAWLMTSIAENPTWTALVQASNTLPVMLFSIVAGALADNFERRNIMLVAQLLMFAASVALVVLELAGGNTPLSLLGITFVLGCGTALNNPAWQASVGDLVSRETIPAAVALNSVTFNVARSIGPAVGGFVVAAGGAVAAFAINAASYVGLIGALARMPRTLGPDALPREHLGAAIATGLRYVFMSPNIEVTLLRAALFGFSGIGIQALLPIVARDSLQSGPLVYGILLGAFGVGAVIGGTFGRLLRERLSSEWFVRICMIAFAGAAALLSIAQTVAATLPALVVLGATWLLALTFFNVAVQLSCPRWVVARALAAYQTALFGGMALGSWLWGAAADSYGVATALQWSALAMLGSAAIGLVWAIPATTRRNLEPVNLWKQPQLAIDLQGRSGPIVITIEYKIDQEDVGEFLRAMSKRRLIRRRNGAIEWMLMRDLERSELWVESFKLPNWIEYVRHNRRTTHDDASVTERIRALHRGEGLPRIRRMVIRPTRPTLDDVPRNATEIG
jgi:MFS family permease